MHKQSTWIVASIVMAVGCTAAARGVAYPAQSSQASQEGGTEAPSRSLEDLAVGIQQQTLVIKGAEQWRATFRSIREAVANPLDTTDGYLLVLARDGGTVSPELALEAMGQLCDRGKARSELLAFAQDWRTNGRRAADAMFVLATDATVEELALFEKIDVEASDDLPIRESASISSRAGFGRTVSAWVTSLSVLEGTKRLEEIARNAAPIGVCPIDSANLTGYWNPVYRRAVREWRKAFAFNSYDTLSALRDISFVPPFDPTKPDFLPRDPGERKKLEESKREGLITLLPPSAREQWAGIKKQ